MDGKLRDGLRIVDRIVYCIRAIWSDFIQKRMKASKKTSRLSPNSELNNHSSCDDKCQSDGGEFRNGMSLLVPKLRFGNKDKT